MRHLIASNSQGTATEGATHIFGQATGQMVPAHRPDLHQTRHDRARCSLLAMPPFGSAP